MERSTIPLAFSLPLVKIGVTHNLWMRTVCFKWWSHFLHTLHYATNHPKKSLISQYGRPHSLGCNHSIFPIYRSKCSGIHSAQAKHFSSRFHRQLAKQHEVHGLILNTRKSQASLKWSKIQLQIQINGLINLVLMQYLRFAHDTPPGRKKTVHHLMYYVRFFSFICFLCFLSIDVFAFISFSSFHFHTPKFGRSICKLTATCKTSDS